MASFPKDSTPRNYDKQLGFGSSSELSGLSGHEYRHLPAHDARVARHARCWANKLLKNGILSRSLHAAVASFPKDSTPRNYDKQLGFGSSSEPRALLEHEYRHLPAHGARVARHASEPLKNDHGGVRGQTQGSAHRQPREAAPLGQARLRPLAEQAGQDGLSRHALRGGRARDRAP